MCRGWVSCLNSAGSKELCILLECSSLFLYATGSLLFPMEKWSLWFLKEICVLREKWTFAGSNFWVFLGECWEDSRFWTDLIIVVLPWVSGSWEFSRWNNGGMEAFLLSPSNCKFVLVGITFPWPVWQVWSGRNNSKYYSQWICRSMLVSKYLDFRTRNCFFHFLRSNVCALRRMVRCIRMSMRSEISRYCLFPII